MDHRHPVGQRGIALLVGARPFDADAAAGPGLVAWAAAVYTLLGIAAGRVAVLAHLSPLERRRVVYGPSVAGSPPTPRPGPRLGCSRPFGHAP